MSRHMLEIQLCHEEHTEETQEEEQHKVAYAAVRSIAACSSL